MHQHKKINQLLAGISKRKLANKLGISYNLFLQKLNGEMDFSLNEALLIKKMILSKKSIEELFS